MKILILGGTTEARELAGKLEGRAGAEILLSLAGRTAHPREQGVPTRIGGFGGAEGLTRFVQDENIRLLIDATHPYADKISVNADRAARESGVAFLSLRRAPWENRPGDTWIEVGTLTSAATRTISSAQRARFALSASESARVPIILAIVPVPTSL